MKNLFFILLMVGCFARCESLGAPYLQCRNNRVDDLAVELKSADIRRLFCELANVSDDQIASVSINLKLVDMHGLESVIGAVLDEEITWKSDYHDKLYDVILEYIRLRSWGFTRAFVYQSLKEQYGGERSKLKEDSDEFYIANAFPDLPIKWLELLKGDLPFGTSPSVQSSHGRRFLIQDSEVSMVVVVNDDVSPRRVDFSYIDSQVLRANLKPAFESAIREITEGRTREEDRISVTYTWDMLKKTLNRNYGIEWKSLADFHPGSSFD